MITTASRVLPAVVVAALLLIGVPLPLLGGPQRPSESTPAHGIAMAAPAAHDSAGALQDPGTVTLARTGVNGDQRLFARDLPDGRLPEPPSRPGIGAPWGRTLLPEAAGVLRTAKPFALPFGRGPPLTPHM